MCIEVDKWENVDREAWKVISLEHNIWHTGPYYGIEIVFDQWMVEKRSVTKAITYGNKIANKIVDHVFHPEDYFHCFYTKAAAEEYCDLYHRMRHRWSQPSKICAVTKVRLAGEVGYGSIPQGIVGAGTLALKASLIYFPITSQRIFVPKPYEGADQCEA